VYEEVSWYSADCAQLGYLLLKRADRRWELRQLSTYSGVYYRCLSFGSFKSHDRARRFALKQSNTLASVLEIPVSVSLRQLLKAYSERSLDDFHGFTGRLTEAIKRVNGQRTWEERNPERCAELRAAGSSPLGLNFWREVPRDSGEVPHDAGAPVSSGSRVGSTASVEVASSVPSVNGGHSQSRSDRPLLSEGQRGLMCYSSWRHERRRAVLRETIEALRSGYADYHARAAQNLARWAEERAARGEPLSSGQVEVVAGDWGEVTLALTKRWGLTFPVLNMANAYVAGGAYLQGTATQEENMFRRTDCHLSLKPEELMPYDPSDPCYVRYTPEVTARLQGRSGRVCLDLERPRVCVRSGERGERGDLGYEWLSGDELFPFYELKAAAMDLRRGEPFSPEECAQRFTALLDTLKAAGQRVAVLGAHGCGAFMNHTDQVVDHFAAVLEARRDDFDLITFAIFDATYGPDSLTPSRERFQGWAPL